MASTRRDWATASSIKTDVTAFGLDGPRQGWPLTIDGNASNSPSTQRAWPTRSSARPTGEPLEPSSSTETATNFRTARPTWRWSRPAAWNGAGGEDIPGPPIVADDGTVFIISTAGGNTTVVGLDPQGSRSRAGHTDRSATWRWTGFCGSGDTGCGYDRTAPAIGPDNALYLLNAACELVDRRQHRGDRGRRSGSRWLARRPQTGGIGVLVDGRRPIRSLMGARDRTREAGVFGHRPGDRGGQHGPVRDHDRRAVARRDPRPSPERRHAGRPPGRRGR